MKSPWKQLLPIDPASDYVILASRIPPKRRSSTWRLFKGSRRVGSQLASTEGVVGFSLLARPIRKEYATLSMWVDDAALDTFARSAQHAQLRRDLAAEMGDTTFVRWTISGIDPVPSWREALERISASTTANEAAAVEADENDNGSHPGTSLSPTSDHDRT